MAGSRRVSSRPARFAIYGGIGWMGEVLFAALTGSARTGEARFPIRRKLAMAPIYGLVQPLFEPLHDRMRGRVPVAARACVYAAGFVGIEYLSGWLIRRATGTAPWDYSAHRRHLHGLITPDYFPGMGSGRPRVRARPRCAHRLPVRRGSRVERARISPAAELAEAGASPAEAERYRPAR